MVVTSLRKGYTAAMAILEKLAGFGGAVKGTLERAFGDPAKQRNEDDNSAEGESEHGTALDAAAAWTLLGLAPSATLDEVRTAASTLARVHHPGCTRKDPRDVAALARVAEASELLEEQLLPLLSPKLGGSASAGASSTRLRATARKPR